MATEHSVASRESVSLYPVHREIVTRVAQRWPGRSFSRAIQEIILFYAEHNDLTPETDEAQPAEAVA